MDNIKSTVNNTSKIDDNTLNPFLKKDIKIYNNNLILRTILSTLVTIFTAHKNCMKTVDNRNFAKSSHKLFFYATEQKNKK